MTLKNVWIVFVSPKTLAPNEVVAIWDDLL